MKFCPNCGAQLPEGAKFCSSCGTPVETTSQTTGKPKQKAFSVDNFRANREAQKQRMRNMKWWHWALIAIGVAIIAAMSSGA